MDLSLLVADRHRFAIEAAELGYLEWNIQTNKLVLSERLLQIQGLPTDDLNKQYELDDLVKYVHPEDAEKVKISISDFRSTYSGKKTEFRIIRPDGEIRWLLVCGSALIYQDPHNCVAVSIFMDITDRKSVEDSLHESLSLFRQVTETISEVFWLSDVSKNKMIYVSNAYETIWGRSCKSLYEKPLSFLEAIVDEDRDRVIEAMQTQAEGRYNVEYRITRPDGTLRYILDKGYPVRESNGLVNRVVGLARDVTKQKLAEIKIAEQQEKIVASAKMSTLGEMAGGIAHEINNPVTIILGKVRQLKQILKNDPTNVTRALEIAETIEKTSDRITKIVKGLKQFSRNAEHDPFQVVPLKAILDDTLSLCLEKFLANEVKVNIENYRADLTIQCRPTEISQVLLNLLSNAYDAVSGQTKKEIDIGVSESDLLVNLTFSDTGPGIPKELRSQIFIPFFSTKEVGVGTGLGLSISKGIIEAHRGKIYLDLEAKKTTFVIAIPKNQPGFQSI